LPLKLSARWLGMFPDASLSLKFPCQAAIRNNDAVDNDAVVDSSLPGFPNLHP
jgi:hypothetical protein